MTDLSIPFARQTRFWTTVEDRVVREHYAAGGAQAVMPLLPHRSRGAIHQRAQILGVPAPATATWKRPGVARYETSDAIDAEIRRVYQTELHKGAISALAHRLQRPRHWVTQRASALGLVAPRLKEPNWTHAELALLEEHAHLAPGSLKNLLKRHGYTRSISAIVVQIKRRGFDRTDPDHYTASQLARLMGVDPKTITRFIEQEGLPAKKRGTARTEVQGGDQWWIPRKRLRAWIGSHAQLVDLRKVDRFWFIDLVCS